jgi:hypothetical protein
LEWARSPSVLPALVIGIATVIAPLVILQPAMGAGIASWKTPRPFFSRLSDDGFHAVAPATFASGRVRSQARAPAAPTS